MQAAALASQCIAHAVASPRLRCAPCRKCLLRAQSICTELAFFCLQPLYVLIIIAFMGYIALAIFFMFRAFHQLKRKPCTLAMQHRCMLDATSNVPGGAQC